MSGLWHKKKHVWAKTIRKWFSIVRNKICRYFIAYFIPCGSSLFLLTSLCIGGIVKLSNADTALFSKYNISHVLQSDFIIVSQSFCLSLSLPPLSLFVSLSLSLARLFLVQVSMPYSRIGLVSFQYCFCTVCWHIFRSVSYKRSPRHRNKT